MIWNAIKQFVNHTMVSLIETASTLKQTVTVAIASPKLGGATAAFTTGSGIGSYFDWIPNDIGKVATLFGLILTIVLIAVHSFSLRKSMVEYEKAKLELDNLKSQEKNVPEVNK